MAISGLYNIKIIARKLTPTHLEEHISNETFHMVVI